MTSGLMAPITTTIKKTPKEMWDEHVEKLSEGES